MSISLIIRCLNEEKYIGKLLSGILAQKDIGELEIIIVDSGSTDKTLEIAAQYPTKIIQIKPEDFSFGYALNFGCQAATGDYLVFASAHVYPLYQDWLQKMIKPFNNLKVGLVYGKQVGNEVTKYSEHQIFKKWFPSHSDLNQNHPFCNNANVAIRKSIWLQIPYNEKLTGLEDLDWAKRIMDRGFKIVYESEATIAHVHEESYQKIKNRYRREAIAHKLIFPEQKLSFYEFIKLFLFNTISDFYHSLYDKILFKNLISIPLFRWNQFLGTYLGYQQQGPITKKLKERFYYPNKLKRKAQKINKNSQKKEINYSEEFSSNKN